MDATVSTKEDAPLRERERKGIKEKNNSKRHMETKAPGKLSLSIVTCFYVYEYLCSLTCVYFHVCACM